MPIKTNLNESNLKTESTKIIYISQIGVKGGEKNYKRGDFWFIPLIAKDVDKMPKWFTAYEKEHGKINLMSLSGLQTQTEFNTYHDRFSWQANSLGGDGKVQYWGAKWIDSGLDVSAGDSLNDPGRELGLNGRTLKNVLAFNGAKPPQFAPSYTYVDYVLVPVLWGVTKRESGSFSIYEDAEKEKSKTPTAEFALLEMRGKQWEGLRKVIEDYDKKTIMWATEDEDNPVKSWAGSAGIAPVVKLDKDGNRGFTAYQWFNVGDANMDEVLPYLNDAYEKTVNFKKDYWERMTPWKTYADQFVSGELTQEEMERKVVASIAMLILRNFGEDLDPDTHTDEVLEIWEREKHKLSYAPGADAAGAILETADGNLGSEDDDFEDGDEF